MQDLPDGAFVCTLSIPGSHDTMTGEGFKDESNAYYSQTQTVSLSDQLNKGVRAIDLRPAISNNELWCNHGPHKTNKSFRDAFTAICDFLDAHPSEFILVHLFPGTPSLTGKYDVPNDLGPYLDAFVADPRFSKYLVPFAQNLQVEHMRGKICLICRYDFVDWKNPMNSVILHNWDNNTDGVYSFPNAKTCTEYNVYREFTAGVQDLAHTDGNNLNKKVIAMKALVDYTSSKKVIPDITNITWGFNFLSAYTDRLVSSADGYAENAERLNKEFIDYISRADYNPGPLGVVLADYVCADSHTYSNGLVGQTKTRTTYGDELIKCIIANNFKILLSDKIF